MLLEPFEIKLSEYAKTEILKIVSYSSNQKTVSLQIFEKKKFFILSLELQKYSHYDMVYNITKAWESQKPMYNEINRAYQNTLNCNNEDNKHLRTFYSYLK